MKPAATSDFSDTELPGYKINAMVFDGDPTRIYRAIRLSDGLPVMLKALTDERMAREASACLRQEFEITKRLSVPGVIKVYGLERHHNLPIIILEDFGGDSLDNLARQRQFTLPEILHIGVSVTQGLSKIHSHQIIHKDINPSNIVYNPKTGITKIIDFGIATVLTREQAAIANREMIEARLPYISPEQTGRMNRSIDYRTDFYSLGVTLYELLSGKPLFSVKEPIEWFHSHIAKQPRTLSEVNPSIPEPVSAVIMKLLSKMAEDRYQSAYGIEADLLQCLNQIEKTGTVAPFPLGTNDIPQQFQIPQRLYGRREQISQLLNAYKRVSKNRNELMLVSGYSGIGKTCLIREIYKPITEHNGFFIAGKFDQLHKNVPYSAIARALKDLIQQLLTKNEDKLTLWRTRIKLALGPNVRIITDVVAELNHIIPNPPEVPQLAPLESEQRFQRAFLNFMQLFASDQHPLVLFLDDLQWADNASLKLFELLLTPETAISNLLVIGAYRDNEVQLDHPFLSVINALKEHGAAVQEIRLNPLNLQDISQLLSDTLGCDIDKVTQLAELIQKKTTGNPFFIEEFLKFLSQKGLIGFSSSTNSWQWDIQAIQAEKTTDNVAELMSNRLMQLPPSAQKLLKLAACIGNRFRLNVLSVVSDLSPGRIASRLNNCILEGLIAPIGDAYQMLELEYNPDEAHDITIEFAFAHDRIQQAAYTLLDDAHKQETHLRIGRLLLNSFDQNQITEYLFEIVNHLNFGIALIDDEPEKQQLADLNQSAGQRAMDSTAYRAAYVYFNHAISLLSTDSWTENYEKTLTLYEQAAEAAYLSGFYDKMSKLLEIGLKYARSDIDSARLIRVRLSSLVAQGNMKQAIKEAKPILRKLGHPYPDNPKKWHIVLQLISLQWHLKKTSPQKMEQLPLMSDPRQLAAFDVANAVGSAAMFTEPYLLTLMIINAVKICLKHGLCSDAPMIFISLGMIMSTYLKQPQQGNQFGQIGLEMVKRMNTKAIEGRVLHCYNALIRHWNEPVRNTLEPLKEAQRLCLENGDFEFAALAPVVRYMNMLDSGVELGTFRQELLDALSLFKSLKQESCIEFVLGFLQFSECTLGETEDPSLLKGKYFDIEKKLPEYLKANDHSLVSLALSSQMMLSYAFNQKERALEQLIQVEPHLEASEGFYKNIINNLYAALIRLEHASHCSGRERRKTIKLAKRDLNKLERWAQFCPENCANKAKLVQAELARIQHDDFRAHALFDESILLAREQNFMYDEALAHELCANMHLNAGRDPIGEAYLIKARDLYLRWGNISKANQLNQHRPKILPKTHIGSYTDIQTSQLDITSLMKALKAIVDEQVHNKMVHAIVATAVEFAGAQRGVLALRNGSDELLIEGEFTTEGTSVEMVNAIPVSESQLPQPLINYVAQSKKSVVIDDAQKVNDHVPGLHMDHYVTSRSLRSVICLPILSGIGNKAELIGLLYLENNLATGTFTEERINTLEIIGMAAAGRLELSRKAAIDGLTGLYNHHYFQTMLAQDFSVVDRHHQPLSLMLLDIDHFKQFNDQWGHQLGDKVLAEVAQCIKNSCRTGDLVARYGGEEMAIIMPDTELSEAKVLAERIRSKIENGSVIHDNTPLKVTISIGVASSGEGIAVRTKDELIENADKALYQSKKSGRNCVTVYPFESSD